jgi:WD40 repeat protein
VYKDGVRDAIFSNDNAFVVLADAFGNTAEVWKLNTGEKVSLTGHNGRINHVAFSPNDACVVTRSEDGTVRVWQTGTGVMWTVLWGYRQGVTGVTFDRNNRTIVVVGHDKILHTHATDGCASTEDLISLATTYVERSYRWHR